MATKDDRSGLLSKVAMFVRNPTKDWSELGQPVDSDAAGYDKQALKAMIERKRQNDFVRKREFDQLRKLRNSDPGAVANVATPSFFQTSLPSDLDGRAVTIKKIDEIEAQMSRQWWMSKNEGLTGSGALSEQGELTQSLSDTKFSGPDQGNSAMSLPFASTLPLSMHQSSDADFTNEFLPTQMAPNVEAAATLDGLVGDGGRDAGNVMFSTSRLFAIAVDDLATDPELEEAAIRFANSDDAGAESGLLAALRGRDLQLRSAQAWAAALLDLHRATGNQQAFDAVVAEFTPYIEGAWPVWYVLGAPGSAAVAEAPQACVAPIWSCPAQLSAQGMESLRVAMVSNTMPWHLDWSALVTIDPGAMPLLGALFSSLCEEPVILRFTGQDCIVGALRAIVPAGSRTIDSAWWQVRLDALRAMGLQDDFELAALDYCVTYEAAPPGWSAPRCHFEAFAAAMPHADFVASTIPMEQWAEGAGLSLLLQGEIVGDASFTLAQLHATPLLGAPLVIACGDLIRVDFAAAGSILNWVAMRQAEGKQVEFRDLNRLVAAFFNVIGINEHAKVMLRSA
jgi:hypothetical protein